MKQHQGFGLVEIIIVISMVTVALFAFLQVGILSVRVLESQKESMQATLLAREAMEAVRSIRDESWSGNVVPLANATAYYPLVQNGKWVLVSTAPPKIQGVYERSVLWDSVFRDAQDRISSSGTLDPDTRKVTARVTWQGAASTTRSVTLVTYLTNFQSALSNPVEAKSIFYEGADTDADLANFPSNNAGDGDPLQSFTTAASAIKVSKAELLLRSAVPAPSHLFLELRSSPTGTVLGTSNILTGSTLATTSSAWVSFRFPTPISLNPSTEYFLRMRSVPDSTIAGSGSVGPVYWIYKQSVGSPYASGSARRYVGRLSNPSDAGQLLDQYDFGFRVYTIP